MGHKRRHNRSARRDRVVNPATLAKTRDLRDALLQQLQIERMTQAQLWEMIKAKYGGNLDKIPVQEHWNHLTDRRMSVLRMGNEAMA